MCWHHILDLFTIRAFGSFCWLESILKTTSQSGEHILGDSGYMLRPYSLTPYRQPGSISRSSYNYAHKRTRVVIEQTFGRWKRRFHCLHGEIRLNRDKVCTIIVACAVLHNMAILWKQPYLYYNTNFQIFHIQMISLNLKKHDN